MSVNVDVYLVDSFLTEQAGSGNPAAVCLVQGPISSETMSYIAQNWSLPETVFARRISDSDWDLRWYTPADEPISPGGNGTVALAFVLLKIVQPAIKTSHPRLQAKASNLMGC